MAYCPYCGHLLNSRALAEPSPAVEVLPPDAADTPPRRRPTFVPVLLPPRPVPTVSETPPAQPYSAPQPPHPYPAPHPPQPYYAPQPPPAQPIEIHVTQTQGSGIFSNCFTTLGVIVFLFFLLPLLCGVMGIFGNIVVPSR